MTQLAHGRMLEQVQTILAQRVHSVWVVQLGSHWIIDADNPLAESRDEATQWRAERDAIDSALLRALLENKVKRVRRAILYDVVSDAGSRRVVEGCDPIEIHRQVTANLAEWKQNIGRHIAFFDDGSATYPLVKSTAPLSIQEVILGRVQAVENHDDRMWEGEHDSVTGTKRAGSPLVWKERTQVISLHGDLSSPVEDANPLAAIPSLDVMEYRRR